ncbi:MAG: exodeoxyribonuclease V subunit gamma [Chthonomonadetes bacterium]|nr:exodeoxyribonuclease V subunit gamma [Chthonomonadetes bacterium]
MKPSLTVWTSPALGGKTRQCIQTCLQEGERARLVLPSELQAQMARAILMAEGMPPATADTVARSFHAFALEVASTARDVHPVPTHLRWWFLQEAVQALGEAHDALKRTMEREGMLTLLSSWAREMAREAVSAEMLESLVNCSEEAEKVSVLAQIWRYYRHLLEAGGWHEEEDVYLLASQALRDPASRKRLPRRVLLDGFSRFSGTEVHLLRALAEAGCEVIVTLCWDAQRPALFESTSATMKWLEEHFQLKQVPISAPADERVAPAIRHIAVHLFAPSPHLAESSQQTPAVEIWEAPHLLAEVEMVARDIVRLHRTGMAWGEIAVLCRNIASILPTVEAIFEQFGIPTQSFETRTLGEHPLVRALVELMRLNADDYPRDSILRWLKSGYLPIGVLEVDHLRLLAVRRGVRSGASGWLHLANEMEREGNPTAALLRTLIECTQAISQCTTPQQWLDELQKGLNRMGFGQTSGGDTTEVEDVLAQAMEVAQQVTSLLGREAGGTPERWAEMVTRAWAITPRRQTQSLRNVVWLLEAARSRPLSPRVAFIMGMQEGRFPRRITEDAFLRDEERRWLNASNAATLQTTADQSAMERFAFYQCVTCARQRVVLTYSRIEGDHDAQSSFYLRALRELFPSDGIIQRSLRLSDITAPLSQTIDENDLERTLVDSLFDRDPHTRRPMDEQERRQTAETVKRWLEQYPDRCRRWWRWRYLPDFPRLSAPPRQIGTRAYSATELEDLQQCPFRHFVRWEMKLRPERTHYTAGQGRWLHAILHHRRRQPEKPLEQILQEVAQQHPIDRPAGEQHLLIQQVEDMVRSVLEREETIYTGFGLQTLLTEAVFGPAVDEEDERAEEAKSPLRMILPDQRQMLICGRIDRVDICPQTGAAVLVDYKRDLPDRWWQSIQAGEDLQTVLYTAALRQVWKLKPAAVALDSALDGKRCRVLFTDNASEDLLRRLNTKPEEGYGVVQRVHKERWRAIEQNAVRKVQALLDRLLAGDISPTPGDHCKVCEYRGLCRVVVQQGTSQPVHDGEPYPADNL